jgi:hypothetical protein
MDLPASLYETARRTNPYKCTDEVRRAYLAQEGEADTHKLCDFDHYVYYVATDRALTDFVATCDTCTHVLVTNGDNGYAPDFLRTALSRHEDIVATSFTHAERVFHTKIRKGQIDLGAVLIRTRVLEGGTKVFLTSLPRGAKAKEVHDADYWFVQDAIDRGASHKIIDRVLFYHH